MSREDWNSAQEYFDVKPQAMYYMLEPVLNDRKNARCLWSIVNHWRLSLQTDVAANCKLVELTFRVDCESTCSIMYKPFVQDAGNLDWYYFRNTSLEEAKRE